MLPRPVTSSSISSSIKQRYIYRLLTRSRPILVLLLLLSLALNFSQWNTNDRRIPKSYLYTSMNKTSFQATSHLIIVAGHAIWKVRFGRSRVVSFHHIFHRDAIVQIGKMRTTGSCMITRMGTIVSRHSTSILSGGKVPV